MIRWLNLALALAGTAGVCWAAGLIYFASTLPAAVADTATRTDAIVVLTGGRGRIETGVDLLQQGMAAKLFVSGAGGQARLADLLPPGTDLPPELAAAITLGREADDTPGNAIETAAWVRREGVASIRLVTAAYHMRRSLLELHAAMPSVKIVPHPVFPATVKSDWWRWPGTASLIAREYSKFLVTWLRIALQGGSAPPSAAGGS
jgi:uncharacterized SAM-binding protein YcdF (DUF218 family)